MNKKNVILPCIVWVIICLAISGISGWASATHVNTWYITLHKPWFQPPAWIFGPMWTLLYIMIGIAGGLLWHNRHSHPSAMKLYILQLVFNFAWSFIFFVSQAIGWALVDIIALWLAIGCTVIAAYRSNKSAAWLLTPYWLWVSFAMMLNTSLWFLNH